MHFYLGVSLSCPVNVNPFLKDKSLVESLELYHLSGFLFFANAILDSVWFEFYLFNGDLFTSSIDEWPVMGKIAFYTKVFVL